MNYLCMEGYTKLVFNFDTFLDRLNVWINENNLTKKMHKLNISRGYLDFGLMVVLLV